MVVNRVKIPLNRSVWTNHQLDIDGWLVVDGIKNGMMYDATMILAWYWYIITLATPSCGARLSALFLLLQCAQLGNTLVLSLHQQIGREACIAQGKGIPEITGSVGFFGEGRKAWAIVLTKRSGTSFLAGTSEHRNIKRLSLEGFPWKESWEYDRI